MDRIDLRTIVLVPLCAVALCAVAGGATTQKTVVATVGSESIYAGDVERILRRVTQGKDVHRAFLPVLQAQVLSEIVDRRLVLAHARREKSGATEAEVDAGLVAFAAKLKARGQSVDGFLKQESITRVDLRRQIAWNLKWERYLAKYVTDQRLASHFEAHRREFDGTQLSVSHILLRPSSDAGPGARDDLVERARAIREEIASGKTTFADAARKHSAGPSAKQDGRLGLIGRQGPMVESFSRAAFALEVGQVSEPVITRFGVHLIRCDKIKPGSKQLGDVRGQVVESLARELLEKLAGFERQHTSVELTGKLPYFKPGTRELVVP